MEQDSNIHQADKLLKLLEDHSGENRQSLRLNYFMILK